MEEGGLWKIWVRVWVAVRSTISVRRWEERMWRGLEEFVGVE